MAWLLLDDPFELIAKAIGPEWEEELDSPIRTRAARWISVGSARPSANEFEGWEHDFVACPRTDGKHVCVHRLRLRAPGDMNRALLAWADAEACTVVSEQASNAGGGFHSDRDIGSRAAVRSTRLLPLLEQACVAVADAEATACRRLPLALAPGLDEVWVNVSATGAWNTLHTHPGRTYSGVYYVSDGEDEARSCGTGLDALLSGRLLLLPSAPKASPEPDKAARCVWKANASANIGHHRSHSHSILEDRMFLTSMRPTLALQLVQTRRQRARSGLSKTLKSGRQVKPHANSLRTLVDTALHGVGCKIRFTCTKESSWKLPNGTERCHMLSNASLLLLGGPMGGRFSQDWLMMVCAQGPPSSRWTRSPAHATFFQVSYRTSSRPEQVFTLRRDRQRGGSVSAARGCLLRSMWCVRSSLRVECILTAMCCVSRQSFDSRRSGSRQNREQIRNFTS